MSPEDPFSYTRSARRADGVAVVAVVWLVIALLVVLVDMVWWIAAPLVLVTLPAAWDIWQGRRAGLTLTRDHLSWFSGRITGDVALRDIDTVRFDTRLDLSVRVTLILKNKTKIRLPHDALPPHRDLEAALRARETACVRHHFALF